MKKKGKVWVLSSGGIDSTACIAFYLKQGFDVSSVFIEYGQISKTYERKASIAISEFYKINHKKITCSKFREKFAGEIRGRNAFLLLTALMELPEYTGILAMGIHAGTLYQDCTPIFIKKMQTIFDIYFKGTIQIGAPFIKWTKNEILAYCRNENIPTEITYSCELGKKQPCGQCLSCQDRELINAGT